MEEKTENKTADDVKKIPPKTNDKAKAETERFKKEYKDYYDDLKTGRWEDW